MSLQMRLRNNICCMVNEFRPGYFSLRLVIYKLLSCSRNIPPWFITLVNSEKMRSTAFVKQL